MAPSHLSVLSALTLFSLAHNNILCARMLFVQMLDYCAMAFRENGIDGFVELTGPMSLEERSVASRKFSSRKDTKIMLLSSAGNVVSNFTGISLARLRRRIDVHVRYLYSFWLFYGANMRPLSWPCHWFCPVQIAGSQPGGS